MKLFVAGATGAIGRHAVPALVAAGHEVTGVARSDAKAAWLRERGARAAQVSIFDRAQLGEVVPGHDAVVFAHAPGERIRAAEPKHRNPQRSPGRERSRHGAHEERGRV